MEEMFFDGWPALFRTVLVGLLAYIGLIALLRVTGKRTLSKMNAFDFVVTVALGSTLATVLLSKDVSLSRGILALGLLIGFQYVITWFSVRTSWVKKLVTGEPTLLVFRGNYLRQALRKTRVTENEIEAAVRAKGLAGLDQADAVVLETDGSFSIVAGSGKSDFPILDGVQKYGTNVEEKS